MDKKGRSIVVYSGAVRCQIRPSLRALLFIARLRAAQNTNGFYILISAYIIQCPWTLIRTVSKENLLVLRRSFDAGIRLTQLIVCLDIHMRAAAKRAQVRI